MAVYRLNGEKVAETDVTDEELYDRCSIENSNNGDTYHVVIIGTYNADTNSKSSKDIFIQPNRKLKGEEYKVTCEITNIKLNKWIIVEKAVKDSDRYAHYFLNVDVKVGNENNSTTVKRTYEVTCTIPGGASKGT
jgi:hypothetical protein